MIQLKISSLGTPRQMQGANGPFQKNYLKVAEGEYAGKFLNFSVNRATSQWKVGDTVEVETIAKRDYTSKKDGSLQTSYDIKLPQNGNAEVYARMEKLENEFAKFKLEVAGEIRKLKPVADDGYPTAESEGITKTAFDDDLGFGQINEGQM